MPDDRLDVSRPEGKKFIKGLRERLSGEVSSSLDSAAFTDYLRNEVITDNNNRLPLSAWLRDRRESLRLGLLQAASDYATEYALSAAESDILGHPFVEKIDIDYRSELGNRRWEAGLSALGALREKADEAVIWQLRGFASGGSSAGGNAGLIYRKVANDAALLGFNVFLDYESHGDYDENFWRWSYGGEIRSAWLDAYLNHYLPITDRKYQQEGANRYAVYTRGGYDAALVLHSPSHPWLSGELTYYHFDGELGQKDDVGLRYGIKLQPTYGSRFLGGNLNLKLEFDDKSGGGGNLGGQISYSYAFNKASDIGYQLSGEYDPRAYFYEQARREYNQRISRVLVNPSSGVLVTMGVLGAGESVFFNGYNGSSFITTSLGAGDGFTFAAVHSLTVRTGENTTADLAANNWTLTLQASSTVRFLSTSVLGHLGGTIRLLRRSGITAIETSGTTVSLLGTDLEVRGGASPELGLFEGSIAYTVTSGTHLRSRVMDGVANVIDGGTSNLVGCEKPSQRRPIGSSYGDTSCISDTNVVLGMNDNTTLRIISQGQTVSVSGGRFTLTAVVGTITTAWHLGANPYAFDDSGTYSVVGMGSVIVSRESQDSSMSIMVTLGRGQGEVSCVSLSCSARKVGLIYAGGDTQGAYAETGFVGTIARVSALQTYLSVDINTKEAGGMIPGAPTGFLAGVSYNLLGVNPSSLTANFTINIVGEVEITNAVQSSLQATLSIQARPSLLQSPEIFAASTLKLQVTIYQALGLAMQDGIGGAVAPGATLTLGPGVALETAVRFLATGGNSDYTFNFLQGGDKSSLNGSGSSRMLSLSASSLGAGEYLTISIQLDDSAGTVTRAVSRKVVLYGVLTTLNIGAYTSVGASESDRQVFPYYFQPNTAGQVAVLRSSGGVPPYNLSLITSDAFSRNFVLASASASETYLRLTANTLEDIPAVPLSVVLRDSYSPRQAITATYAVGVNASSLRFIGQNRYGQPLTGVQSVLENRATIIASLSLIGIGGTSPYTVALLNSPDFSLVRVGSTLARLNLTKSDLASGSTVVAQIQLTDSDTRLSSTVVLFVTVVAVSNLSYSPSLVSVTVAAGGAAQSYTPTFNAPGAVTHAIDGSPSSSLVVITQPQSNGNVFNISVLIDSSVSLQTALHTAVIRGTSGDFPDVEARQTLHIAVYQRLPQVLTWQEDESINFFGPLSGPPLPSDYRNYAPTLSYSLLGVHPSSLASHFLVNDFNGLVNINSALPVAGAVSVTVRVEDGLSETVDSILSLNIVSSVSATSPGLSTVGILVATTVGTDIATLSFSGGTGAYLYNLQPSDSPLTQVSRGRSVLLRLRTALPTPQSITVMVYATDNYTTVNVTQVLHVGSPLYFEYYNNKPKPIRFHVGSLAVSVYTVSATGIGNKMYALESAVVSPASARSVTVTVGRDDGVVSFVASSLQLTSSVEIVVRATDNLGSPAVRQTLELHNHQFTVLGPLSVTVKSMYRGVIATVSAKLGVPPYSYFSPDNPPLREVTVGASDGKLSLIADLSPGYHNITIRASGRDKWKEVSDIPISVFSVLSLQMSTLDVLNLTTHNAYSGVLKGTPQVVGGGLPFTYSFLGATPVSLGPRFQVLADGSLSLVAALPFGKVTISVRTQDVFSDTLNSTLTVEVVSPVEVWSQLSRVTIVSGSTRPNDRIATVAFSGGSGGYLLQVDSPNPPLADLMTYTNGPDVVFTFPTMAVSFTSPREVLVTIRASDSGLQQAFNASNVTVVQTLTLAVPLSFSSGRITVDVGGASGSVYTVRAIGGGNNTYALAAAVTTPITVLLNSNGVVNFGGALQLNSSVTLEVIAMDRFGNPAQRQTVVLDNGSSAVSFSSQSINQVLATGPGSADRPIFVRHIDVSERSVPPFKFSVVSVNPSGQRNNYILGADSGNLIYTSNLSAGDAHTVVMKVNDVRATPTSARLTLKVQARGGLAPVRGTEFEMFSGVNKVSSIIHFFGSAVDITAASGAVQYAIISTNPSSAASHFSINPSSGLLTLASVFPNTVTTSVTVRVRVWDTVSSVTLNFAAFLFPNMTGDTYALTNFHKQGGVYGISVYATRGVTESNFRHALTVILKYLNTGSGSGRPTDAKVAAQLADQTVVKGMFLFRDERERGSIINSDSFEAQQVKMNLRVQDLQNDEINVNYDPTQSIDQNFDATYEEVLHLLTDHVFAKAYPTLYGTVPDGGASAAMDVARGGRYTHIPRAYPSYAWYTYYDTGCDYACQLTEYFYWGLSTYAGLHNNGVRANFIRGEWSLKNRTQLQSTDTLMFKLLQDGIRDGHFQDPFARPPNVLALNEIKVTINANATF